MNDAKNNYLKLNKSILVEKIIELENYIKNNEKKIKNYDIMENKYSIIKGAREEDLKSVKVANEFIETYKKKELDLVRTFTFQLNERDKNISEQNQTILTLFEMMDNSINQQIFYYSKFKGIFVNMNNLQEEPDGEKTTPSE